MTSVWMEECGLATNETDPARIASVSLDPRVLNAARKLVADRRVRSETSVLLEHLCITRGYLDERKLGPKFSQRQEVERSKSGISSCNMADICRSGYDIIG